MDGVFVGVGQATLLFRYARSLKDKRRVMQGLIQKIRNLGLSVSEVGDVASPQRGILAYTCVSSSIGLVDSILDTADRLFIGDFECLSTDRDVFDYTGEDDSRFALAANDERYE